MKDARMRLQWALIFLVARAGAGCDKAPPELPPQHAVHAAGSAEVLASAAPHAPPSRPRCMIATGTPPPPPRYRVDPGCPTDPAGSSPMVPIGHVAFPESRDAPRLEVELMLTEKTQERGLMYRKTLADEKGMLFVWSRPSVHTFWMHNTCVPLDMLFIDDAGYIAGIVENAPTLNDEGRSIACPVVYVLEVNAGWSRRHGVQAGQKVQIEGVPQL
jgi:uncharacterized membrane protein (UPF0127 family)